MPQTRENLLAILHIWHTKTTYKEKHFINPLLETVKKYLLTTTPLNPKNLNRIIEKSMYETIQEETFSPEHEAMKLSLKRAFITPREAEQNNPELFDRLYRKGIAAYLNQDLPRTDFVTAMEDAWAGYCKNQAVWGSITKSI